MRIYHKKNIFSYSLLLLAVGCTSFSEKKRCSMCGDFPCTLKAAKRYSVLYKNISNKDIRDPLDDEEIDERKPLKKVKNQNNSKVSSNLNKQ